ncbi:hypothetical protein CFIO01_06233 [Colletotrichum fioriniae PJ7]|uniref:Uncharacterized protein n=1 Tax=Colletotrichum fioriniae PJ7 TaxID=1445577 RepID=A0A010RRH9_9PEZI|nr:hypothetical protein CFIO01_06233 [Colletotrichum fioriniae PJ7]
MDMEPLTNIKDVLYHWIENDGGTKQNGVMRGDRVFDTIQNAYSERGGWEGWAQVEIAHIIKANYTSLSVTREDGVYHGNTKRSDLVLDNGFGTRNIIELKCQRGSADANPAWIVQQVLDDAHKLQQTLKPEFRPAKCFAVGIAVTPEAIEAFRNPANWRGVACNWQACKNNRIITFWVETDVE